MCTESKISGAKAGLLIIRSADRIPSLSLKGSISDGRGPS